MQGQSGSLRGNARRLVEELGRQILPDGGHISRNPGVLIELLIDLLPLRQLFSARNLQPPQALNNAIDRMMPMLRFFRHGDGNFAQFNGMGPTPVDLLATVLAYDDARGAPVAERAAFRLPAHRCRTTALLMDTGKPPPLRLSQEAHAGCLSFELSWTQHRLVVNCGLPAVNKENWRQVARATAAHSTVTFNDTSSCRFLESRRSAGCCSARPSSAARATCGWRARTTGGRDLRASHDGYADDFGVIHHRTLRLSPDGRLLDGEDSFAPADGDTLPVDQRRRIRHPLPPAPADQGQPADRRPRRDAAAARPRVVDLQHLWRHGGVEESVFLSGSDGPRRTVQIVIYGQARAQAKVRWSFRHTPPAPPGTRPEQADEPELPL